MRLGCNVRENRREQCLVSHYPLYWTDKKGRKKTLQKKRKKLKLSHVTVEIPPEANLISALRFFQSETQL